MAGNSLHDQLRLQDPVPIDGPFPTISRIADVADLLQLQVSSVPGVGPMPVSVRVWSTHGLVAFMEAVATGGAVYHPAPGQTITGSVGTNNFSIFLKALRPGNDQVTLQFRMSDGSHRRVPFVFIIS